MQSKEAVALQNIMPHFTLAINRICTPSWTITERICQVHNFLLVYEGEGIFQCNGMEFRASRGNFIYYKPGDYRFAYTVPENLMKCYTVNFLYTCPVLEERQWTLSTPELPFDTMDRINDSFLFARFMDLFHDLSKAWISDKQSKVFRSRAIFMEIMRLLLLWKSKSEMNYDKVRKVEKVINFMAENYRDKLILDNMAEVIQISPSYLGSIFREVTGKTPIEYLIGIRLNRAKEFIKDGYSISEAANQVGFSDVYYFSKCFKKYEGIVPTQYRLQNND